MRLVEATFREDCKDRVKRAVEEAAPTYYRLFDADESGAMLLKAFFGREDIQKFVDALQTICAGQEGFRILVLPVEATAPPLEDDKDNDRETRKRVALREEIYEDVAGGAEAGGDFFILTLASTTVAAIGLVADNIAAVIGAMVIAPLLGPILAFSFATALGDIKLLVRSAKTAVAGLLTGVVAAVLISLVMPVNLHSRELISRTIVGVDSIALALAAGVAAALCIVTGVSSALVGVMVAVALLPPAAAIGLFFGAGDAGLAARAALLLATNVVCIMLAAQAVYAYKGVRPRTWLEKRSARNAVRINFGVLVGLLAILTAVIIVSQSNILPTIAPDAG